MMLQILRPRHTMRQIAATRRLVCTAAATSRLLLVCRCDQCCTNSNQFEFVRQIAATKFCLSDDDFHMSHEAICYINLSRRRVAAICRIVCFGLKLKFQKHMTSSTLFAIRVFQTSEIDPRSLHGVTLHCLLCKKSIEMNLSRKRAT